MDKTIYKVLDVCNDREYFCASKLAVRQTISDLTALPINSDAVKEAAKGQSSSFQVTEEILNTGR